jgi:hypothetical protein
MAISCYHCPRNNINDPRQNPAPVLTEGIQHRTRDQSMESLHTMIASTPHGNGKLESDLWSAADNLRANSKLTSSDYFMPVLGIIFLRHAANRFAAARRQIEEDQASGRMPRRRVVPEDYVRRRALWLPEQAR